MGKSQVLFLLNLIVFKRFYYDFLITDKQLSVEDLNIIKKEMDKIIKANLPIVREDVQRDDIKYVLSV